MNSLKTMAKMEDEMKLISAIYVQKLLSLSYSQNQLSYKNAYLYIHRVDEAINALDESCKQLIDNDFINPCEPLWWKPFYSDERYLYLRFNAVSSFLTHFYEV